MRRARPSASMSRCPPQTVESDGASRDRIEEAAMQDDDIFGSINRLVEEERELRDGGDLDALKRQRLDAVEVQLDQCWDLLRQRRGRRHAGADPDDASVRDPKTVERYQQ
jgi:hypothetical protein